MSQLEERLSVMHMIGSGYLPPEAGLDQLNMVSERRQKRVHRPEHAFPRWTVEMEGPRQDPKMMAFDYTRASRSTRWWPVILWMGAGLILAASILTRLNQ